MDGSSSPPPPLPGKRSKIPLLLGVLAIGVVFNALYVARTGIWMYVQTDLTPRGSALQTGQGRFVAAGSLQDFGPHDGSLAKTLSTKRHKAPYFLVVADFEGTVGASGGHGSSHSTKGRFDFGSKSIEVPLPAPPASFLLSLPEPAADNVFLLRQDGTLAALPLRVGTMAQLDAILAHFRKNRTSTPVEDIERILRETSP